MATARLATSRHEALMNGHMIETARLRVPLRSALFDRLKAAVAMVLRRTQGARRDGEELGQACLPLTQRAPSAVGSTGGVVIGR